MRTWSPDLAKEIPCKKSTASLFTKREKAILFVAGPHTRGPVEGNSSFTFIKKKYEKFKPDILLIEGLDYSMGTSPQSAIQRIKKCKEENFVNCQESHFSSSLALEDGIPFQGAEPSDAEIIESLAPRYSRKDYLSFFWHRNLIRWKRRQKKSISFKDDLPRMKSSMKKQFGKKMDVNFADFVIWYEKKLGEGFDPEKIKLNSDEPLSSKQATFPQKMAYQIEKVREPAIQKGINHAINSFDKVMIVYGSGHYPKQKLALEEAFGEPRIHCSKAALNQ